MSPFFSFSFCLVFCFVVFLVCWAVFQRLSSFCRTSVFVWSNKTKVRFFGKTSCCECVLWLYQRKCEKTKHKTNLWFQFSIRWNSESKKIHKTAKKGRFLKERTKIRKEWRVHGCQILIQSDRALLEAISFAFLQLINREKSTIEVPIWRVAGFRNEVWSCQLPNLIELQLFGPLDQELLLNAKRPGLCLWIARARSEATITPLVLLLHSKSFGEIQGPVNLTKHNTKTQKNKKRERGEHSSPKKKNQLNKPQQKKSKEKIGVSFVTNDE